MGKKKGKPCRFVKISDADEDVRKGPPEGRAGNPGRGSRSRRKRQRSPIVYEPDPDDDAVSGDDVAAPDDDVAYDLYSLAETVVQCWKLSHMKLKPKQETVSDLKRFHLSTQPSSNEVDHFYDESLKYFQEEFPFSVPGSTWDGDPLQVPITPEKEPDLESRRHHLIVFTRKSDEAKAEVVVEEYSQYVVASRVLYVHDDPKKVPFCFFGDKGDDLPARFYVPRTKKAAENVDAAGDKVGKAAEDEDGKAAEDEDGKAAEGEDGKAAEGEDGKAAEGEDGKAAEGEDGKAAEGEDGEADTILNRTRYGPEYEYRSRVQVGEETVDIIFSFLEKLQAEPKQKPTKKGYTVLNTLYVFSSEGRRFRLVKQWILSKIGHPLGSDSRIPLGLTDIITDWSALCKCIFLLYLALLEEGLIKGVDDGVMQAIAALTMEDATVLWRERQTFLNQGELRFFQEKKPLNLGILAGGEVLVLRHSHEYCDQLLMRLSGYRGYWLSMI